MGRPFHQPVQIALPPFIERRRPGRDQGRPEQYMQSGQPTRRPNARHEEPGQRGDQDHRRETGLRQLSQHPEQGAMRNLGKRR